MNSARIFAWRSTPVQNTVQFEAPEDVAKRWELRLYDHYIGNCSCSPTVQRLWIVLMPSAFFTFRTITVIRHNIHHRSTRQLDSQPWFTGRLLFGMKC